MATIKQVKELDARISKLERFKNCPNGLSTTTGIPTEAPECGNNFVFDPADGSVYYWNGTIWVKLPTGEEAVVIETTLNATEDDWEPTDFGTANIIKVTPDGNIRGITGIAAGEDWEEKTLVNVDNQNSFYLAGEHPNSTAANRIVTSKDHVVFGSESVTIIYDPDDARWRIKESNRLDVTNTGKGNHYTWYPASDTAGDQSDVEWGFSGTASITSVSHDVAYVIYATNSVGAYARSWMPKNIDQMGRFARGHAYVEAPLWFTVLSSDIDDFTITLQLTSDPASGTIFPNNTIGVRYNHTYSSGNWELYSIDNAGTVTTVDTGVTTATSWTKMRIEYDKAGSEARLYINDQMEAIIDSGLPNSGVEFGARFFQLKGTLFSAKYTRLQYLKAGIFRV